MKRLTQEEIDNVDWNEFNVGDIETLIDLGYITDSDMQWYYCNKQWRDVV